jgi:Tfp pilus assembly protein PilF
MRSPTVSKEEALRQMQSAAELEDGMEKSAATPGPLAPARELLGEMLLEMKEPTQALEQFEATLKKEPERFRALYGAAHAAQLSGKSDASQKYFRELYQAAEQRLASPSVGPSCWPQAGV